MKSSQVSRSASNAAEGMFCCDLLTGVLLQVLLCQFHAVRYIRNRLGRAKYAVPLPFRQGLEDMFRSMMYATSIERYKSEKMIFEKHVRKISLPFLQYFRKNWGKCSDMWSNYGRRQRFSAGNTTTNRIESSWNQFKQLLGKKSSLDKCVRVLLQHQVCVLRQFSNSLSMFEVRPPYVASIPVALRALGQVLSSYCLQRVQRQWDYHVAKGENWSWHYEPTGGGDVYKFKSSTGNAIQVTWRDDEESSCDCLFYASSRLPCQHLFNVVATQRVQTVFKVAQLCQRWSMVQARDVESALSRSIRHLTTVRQVCDADGPTLPSPVVPLLPARKRISYVKLKRGEKCEQAVLSNCEKFNVLQAELLPVIDTMQRQPSHQFLKQFTDLRSVLDTFQKKWSLDTSAPPTGNLSDDELDEASDIDDSVRNVDDDELLAKLDRGGREAARSTERSTECREPPIIAEQDDEQPSPRLQDFFVCDNPSQVTQPDLEWGSLPQPR